MKHNLFLRFDDLAPALRPLCRSAASAPMHRQAAMYHAGVYNDDFGFHIVFAYDIHPFLYFRSSGSCLTACV